MKVIVWLFLIVIFSCSNPDKDTPIFSQKKWIESFKLDGGYFERDSMVYDLANNYLKSGMKKLDVVRLLGASQPNLCSGCVYQFNIKNIKDTKSYALYGRRLFELLSSKEDTSFGLIYEVGYSGSGPNRLIVVFDGKDELIEVLFANAI